jgi:hypothetical protein
MSVSEFRAPNIITRTAEEAVTQYRFAKKGTAVNDVGVCDANTDGILGIFCETRPSGAVDTPVALPGCIGKLTVDGSGTAIERGDLLVPTTNGIGIKLAVDKHFYGAMALEDATGATDIIDVVVMKGQGSL